MLVGCVMLGRWGEGVGDGDNIRRWVGYANNAGIALLFELVCWLGRRLGRYDNPARVKEDFTYSSCLVLGYSYWLTWMLCSWRCRC